MFEKVSSERCFLHQEETRIKKNSELFHLKCASITWLFLIRFFYEPSDESSDLKESRLLVV